MGFGLQIAVQTDPGIRVKKRLPERLDRDSGHLDEAGGTVLLQVLRIVTSEAFRIAGELSRLCWASLFSMIGLIPSGASPTGPGSAQASMSGWVQTLTSRLPRELP